NNGYLDVLDLCSGSGCVGLSIANLSKTKVTLADISPKALNLSKKNAKTLGIKCKFILSDGFNKIKKGAKFNLIISNPPYIIESDYAQLEPEVKQEPKLALTASENGMYFYKLIADNARKFLYNGGCVIVELNSKLDNKVFEVFKLAGLQNLEFIKGYDSKNIGLKGYFNG
ncbi:MAG: peptide chain release factor N(5)-glutamine methyltransferase, partial [Elusimicrobia bacterium]|nr:peptide chain release factor N(5)-glutamine methyltransferase [Elusimicrobiota bacterium]